MLPIQCCSNLCSGLERAWAFCSFCFIRAFEHPPSNFNFGAFSHLLRALYSHYLHSSLSQSFFLALEARCRCNHRAASAPHQSMSQLKSRNRATGMQARTVNAAILSEVQSMQPKRYCQSSAAGCCSCSPLTTAGNCAASCALYCRYRETSIQLRVWYGAVDPS